MQLRYALAASALGMVAAPHAVAQDSILGEIREFGFNFCPRGWAETNGALLSISQNTALFSLLGTLYGGDGRTTFALPTIPTKDTTGAQPAIAAKKLPITCMALQGIYPARN